MPHPDTPERRKPQGISNHPVEEEAQRQERLPPRGTDRDATRPPGRDADDLEEALRGR